MQWDTCTMQLQIYIIFLRVVTLRWALSSDLNLVILWYVYLNNNEGISTQLSRSCGTGSEKNLIAQLLIWTVAKWAYGSGENQFRAICFLTIAIKWECGSGGGGGTPRGPLYVLI